jgi:hypothetical protein
MGVSFYIHYNGNIPTENHTLFELFILYFSDALLFKTQETDPEVFNQTLDYLKRYRINKNENFCGSKEKGVPGMRLGYLKYAMRKPNYATLISYSIDEKGNNFRPMAILVFKNGNPTDKGPPKLFLDGMCSDQLRPIKGMGSQLISIFIDAAKDVGFQFIELAAASKQAVATWKKKGFEKQIGVKSPGGLPIYSKQLGGEGDTHILIDLQHNNNILVCDETCKNLGPLLPEEFNSLDGIDNYINEQIGIKKGGGKTKKYKTKKYKTKKHKTKRYKTK